MRQHVADEAHSPHQEQNTDGAVGECQRGDADERRAHEPVGGKRLKKDVLGADHAASTFASAAANPACAKSAAVNTAAVLPAAMHRRASSTLRGKWRRTCERSCSTATIVRPSLCHSSTSRSKSTVVVASIPAKGSSKR